MSDAKVEFERGGASGTLVLAERQTHGQGRKGRPWASQPKGNLYFTLLMHLPNMETAAALNFSVAVAVAETCRSFGVPAAVKWPNDVVVDGKKICGMLLNTAQHEVDGEKLFVAHVGVGINVNEDMKENPDAEVKKIATSFYSHLGKPISREKVLATFLNTLELELIPLPFAKLMSKYQAYDSLIGKVITVAPKAREDAFGQYNAKAVGFSKEGFLIVETMEGVKRTLVSEEVMIRPAAM